MVELTQFRKNKVVLSDYDFEKDLSNRLLMTKFTNFDLEVLEEILYNTTRIPMKKLLQNLSISEEDLLPSLSKLSKSSLLNMEDDTIIVDKEMRKYYELQALRFDEDFKPDMEFLQSLLKKVPIHILPNWYSISRTSDSIFDSIIERYFQTPQIYQRYILDFSSSHPLLGNIIQDVFNSEQLLLPAKQIQEKHGLSQQEFEEHMLFLEYNFALCVSFRKVDENWIQVVTPFYEWKKYLSFIRDTMPTPIQEPDSISPKRPGDFSFVRDMSAVLSYLAKDPIPVEIADKDFLISQDCIEKLAKHCGYFELDGPISILEAQTYLTHVIEKLCLIHLATCEDGKLIPSSSNVEWKQMDLETQAHHLYRHPLNHLISAHISSENIPEKSIRETEKSIERVAQIGWVYYDEFAEGLLIPLNEDSIISIKKSGRSWEYALPQYTEEEKALVKAIILEWLYEAGMVNVGTLHGKDCFCVTAFGRSFFEG